MLCYVKDVKTFETTKLVECTSYALAEGENGEATIYEKDASNLSNTYIGNWLVIKGELFYISGAMPNDNSSVKLEIQNPIYLFSRPVEYDDSLTHYGELIANIITENYGVNCPDSAYKMSYISVNSTDNTPCTVNADEYGYIIPYEIFENAIVDGVKIEFIFTNSSLSVRVSKANYEEGIVLFNDGITTLESESYSDDFIAKLSVIHDLTEEGEDEETFEVIDYYLSEDGTVSTTVPAHRAKGIWAYANADKDTAPELVAVSEFLKNSSDHKIEFRSKNYYALCQPIKIRLRGSLFKTIITSRVLSSGDDRYYYKCGNLATSLTDKIAVETSQATGTIKKLKKTVASTTTNLLVEVNQGGTGARSASEARTNLGLGDIAVENAPLALNKGGTGGNSLVNARANLGLPFYEIATGGGSLTFNTTNGTRLLVFTASANPSYKGMWILNTPNAGGTISSTAVLNATSVSINLGNNTFSVSMAAAGFVGLLVFGGSVTKV